MPATPTAGAGPGARRMPGRAARVALSAWLALNLLVLGSDFRDVVFASGARPGVAGRTLLALPSALLLTGAAWLVFFLTRRYPVARRGLVPRAAAHLSLAMGTGCAELLARKALRLFLVHPGAAFAASRDGGELVAVTVTYALMAVVAHALEYSRRLRAQELAELRLAATLAASEMEQAAARLRVLKLQLNPHFVFNALHTVSVLVRVRADDATRIVSRLAELLRGAQESVATQEVALAEETRGLLPFLEIEQLRMGGRLRVEWAIDPEALGGLVPHMILQPLVENAVKHGVSARAGGHVRILAARQGERLTLRVEDDGRGLNGRGDAAARRGVGTANVRGRLEQLYGASARFELSPRPEGGTCATVDLPWHEHPRSPAAPAEPAPDPEPPPPPGAAGRWGAGAALLAVFVWVWRSGYAAPRVGADAGVPDGVWLAIAAAHAVAVTLLVRDAFTRPRRGRLPGAPSPRRAGLAWRAARMGFLVTLVSVISRLLAGGAAGALLTAARVAADGLAVAAWGLVYALLAAVAHALEAARRAREREASTLRLQERAARSHLARLRADLDGLRLQRNPQFLLDTLDHVSRLIATRPDQAERVVVALADFLRDAMAASEAPELALDDELRRFRPFLDVLAARNGGQLRLDCEVEDVALDALVPQVVLQSAAEGALTARPPGGDAPLVLTVAARSSGDALQVEVGVDGAEPSAAALAEAERLLDPLRRRMAQLYGEAARVELSLTAGTARVTLALPWRDEPASVPVPPTPALAVPA